MKASISSLKRPLKSLFHRAQALALGDRYKGWHELRYWKERATAETVLSNAHYSYFYTDFFGLHSDFFREKRLLDIGCGPRGSLEWAIMATERVGVDPLADDYLKIGADKHQMDYVCAPSERMPFADEHFDVLTSFNSLDHVDNLEETVREIKRVLRRGGTLLVIVEVNHPPTATEPVTLDWDVASLFQDEMDLVSHGRYEIGDHDIYDQLRKGAFFDDTDPRSRSGIWTGRFLKR